jgi:predicted nucleic-acid-binding Zn-ribbon protein
MEKFKIEYRKHTCKKCGHFYTTTNPAFSPEHFYYGTIFFFTEGKEIATIIGKNSILQEFVDIIETYPNKDLQRKYGAVRVWHLAWERFADKSQKGYPFYIWGMSSVCPQCGNDDFWQIDMIMVEEEIEAQPILYTQWNLYSHREKEKILYDFFEEYVDNFKKKYEL